METTNNESQEPSSPALPLQPQAKRTSVVNRPLPLLPPNKSPQLSPGHSPRDSNAPPSPKPMEPQLSPTKNGGQPKTPRKKSTRHTEDEFSRCSGVDFSDFEPIENIPGFAEENSSQTEPNQDENQELKENSTPSNEPTKNGDDSQITENEENNSKENQKNSKDTLKKSGENLINSDDQVNNDENAEIQIKVENAQIDKIEKKKNEERTPTTKRRSSMYKEERLKTKKEKSKEKSEEKSEEASDLSENKSGEEKRKKKKKKKHHGSQIEETKEDESDSGSGSSSNQGSEIKAPKPEENFSRRHKIVNEIVSTEKSYIENLERLLKLFAPLIEAKFDQNEFPVNEMNSLQSNAGIILGYSGVFLQMINKAVADFNENETTIGPIFLNLADYMRVYTQYIKAYEPFISKFAQCVQKNKTVKEILPTPSHFLQFESCLIVPVQRIPRYQLLIQDLIRSTPEEHQDYPKLISALAKINEIGNYVNEQQRFYDGLNQVVELNERFGKQLTDGTGVNEFIRSHRRLIKEKIFQIDRSNKLKSCQVYLLTDLILIGSLKDGKFLGAKLYHLICLWLVDFKLVIDPSRQYYGICFTQEGRADVIITATTQEQAEEWINLINGQKEQLDNSIIKGHDIEKLRVSDDVSWNRPAIPAAIAQALAEEEAQKRSKTASRPVSEYSGGPAGPGGFSFTNSMNSASTSSNKSRSKILHLPLKAVGAVAGGGDNESGNHDLGTLKQKRSSKIAGFNTIGNQFSTLRKNFALFDNKAEGGKSEITEETIVSPHSPGSSINPTPLQQIAEILSPRSQSQAHFHFPTSSSSTSEHSLQLQPGGNSTHPPPPPKRKSTEPPPIFNMLEKSNEKSFENQANPQSEETQEYVNKRSPRFRSERNLRDYAQIDRHHPFENKSAAATSEDTSNTSNAPSIAISSPPTNPNSLSNASTGSPLEKQTSKRLPLLSAKERRSSTTAASTGGLDPLKSPKSRKHIGRLFIRVLEARKLVLKKSTATISAFVQLEIPGRIVRTSVSKKAVRPVWKKKNEFVFELYATDEGFIFLVISLFDSHKTKDKAMGEIAIKLDTTKIVSRQADKWFTLKSKKDDTTAGEIRVQLHFLCLDDIKNNVDLDVFEEKSVDDTLTLSEQRLIDYLSVVSLSEFSL